MKLFISKSYNGLNDGLILAKVFSDNARKRFTLIIMYYQGMLILYNVNFSTVRTVIYNLYTQVRGHAGL